MYNLSLIWAKIHAYVTAGLGVGLIIASLGWYVTDLKLDAERLARENDKTTYEKAQAEYEAKALREKLEIEERDRKRAKEANDRYDALYSQYQSNLVRFREAQRSLSGTYLPRTAGAAEGGDRSSTSTELPSAVDTIIISFEDAEICAENTARIKIVQEWATKEE